ncbi:MAG: dTDP-glucose 4,6-dehydratase [Syntrophus sp. SKADARSKE-3]|nr:dTDP-glucose 4,6-dehydratase [Syntrophus sp. SKADARSKE-3]
MNKILVTGAAGFIGSHLAESLVQKGHHVKAFVRYNSQSNWGWLEKSPYRKQMEIVSGDIRDFDSVYRAVKGCSGIFHLAALIGIPYSYESPLSYIKTNVEGTYNILESARMLDCEKVVITSTSETYGTAQFVPITEEHPLVGQSPYSATKIAADQLAISYHKSFKMPVTIVRPFNTYGPRQSARAFIPTVISQIISGQKILHLGNLTPTRDLTFVLDTVEGFIKIAASDRLSGQVTNIGSNFEISMMELARMIGSICGSGIEISEDQERIRPENSEVERLLCDNRKIMASTDWRPDYSLEQGLKATIRWIGENIDLYKTDLYQK